MFDIVGKRNWYFAFSALITIPGLIFIALGGLKPSVDYTGGTVWQVRYAQQPSAQQVEAAMAELGHPESTVHQLPEGFVEIRTEPIDLRPPPTPAPTPSVLPSASGASGSPDASASAGSSASARPTRTPRATPTPEPSPTASVAASASAAESPGASGSAAPSASPSAAA